MIGFYIKKNFFDGWDNFLSLIVFNLISYVILFGLYFLISLVVDIPLLFFCFLFIGIYVSTLLFFSMGMSTAEIARYKSASILSLFSNIPLVWKEALFLSLLYLALFISATVALPFYFTMGGVFGLSITAIIFWIIVMTLLALQWFIPLSVQLKGGFLKSLKKSYLLFLDNGGFSLCMAIYTILLVIVSALLAFFAPGFSGISLAQNNALKLRLYKYDWLEENPDIAQTKERKNIPWDELLAEDDEIIGPRSFKSLIFPWK